MRKLPVILTLFLAVALIAGCAAKPSAVPAPQRNLATSSSADAYGKSVPPAQPAAPAQAPATGAGSGAGFGATVGNSQAPDDSARMIIRTVSSSLVVSDAAKSMQDITRLAGEAGGYVSDSNTWRDNDKLRATMTVRVPATGLDSLLTALHGLAVRVDHENVTGQDVTEQYTDLNAQLTNLEATEAQLRELLAEVRQKTQKAEDVLAVYRELTQIRGQIEQIKGRIQYLSKQTAMATIKIELIPDALAQPVVEPGWRPLATIREASRASVNAMKGAVDAIIWVVIYGLPLLLIIVVPIVLIVLALRWLLRKTRGPRQPPAPKGVKPEAA